MAAKIDPKAKEKRAKKIAIGGGILLVLLLAYEGPKTMKALNPPAPKTAASESASASASTTTTTGASTSAAAAPVASPVPVSAALTTQLAPAPKAGQLSVLTTAFKSKDPFKQLIKDETTTPAAPAPATAPPAAAAKPSTPKAPPASLAVVPQPTPTPAVTPATAPAAPVAKPARLPFISATLSVNGVKEGVDAKGTFPAAAPMFALVTLTAKTVTIKVSGGSLASGAATLTLKRGKPLTLVNTADGTRYRLVLLATSTAAAVPPATATAPATTTPTSTTPATTTAG